MPDVIIQLPAQAGPEADFAEIAAALGIRKQSVHERSTKESWLYREQPGRGGKKRLFPLAALPADVKNALLMHGAAVLPAPTSTSSSSPVATTIRSIWASSAPRRRPSRA